MATARACICNKKGLHARAAAKLVKTASSYDARIEVIRLPRAGEEADPAAKAGATSILSLLMLAAERGVDVELRGEGNQAAEAIAAIVALIERKFDEEE
jgi:phosphocarrier protein HPr